MKRIVAALLTILTVLACFTACGELSGGKEIELPAYEGITEPDYSSLSIPADFKVGIICLHGEESTYDKNFIDSFKRAATALGLKEDQYIIKTGIPEDTACYDNACDLADSGCDLVFADSFGHEKYMMQAAEKYPNVQFCHATGTMAHTSDLANHHNAFASIYEGRYLAGIVAGMKLKEMIDNGTITKDEAKLGYVGAYTYAEVISGYTSYYLGAKSVFEGTDVNVTMDVRFTGSWYDVTAEKEAAEALIEGGCKVLSQHADSMGAPSACETAGVPNVSYNGSTFEACPETFLVSSSINWTPYFKYIIAQTAKGEAIDKDWTGTLATGSVVLSNLGGSVAKGTKEAVVEARTKLAKGELEVFDTSKFTVGGKNLTSYLADVDTDDAYTPDTEVVSGGVFEESNFRSAPYFDLRIDNINLLNEKY